MTIYRTFETVLPAAQMTSHSGFTVVEEHNIRQGEASYAEIEQCVLGRTIYCYTTCRIAVYAMLDYVCCDCTHTSHSKWKLLMHISSWDLRVVTPLYYPADISTWFANNSSLGEKGSVKPTKEGEKPNAHITWYLNCSDLDSHFHFCQNRHPRPLQDPGLRGARGRCGW